MTVNGGGIQKIPRSLPLEDGAIDGAGECCPGTT